MQLVVIPRRVLHAKNRKYYTGALNSQQTDRDFGKSNMNTQHLYLSALKTPQDVQGHSANKLEATSAKRQLIKILLENVYPQSITLRYPGEYVQKCQDRANSQ